ncbi:hypothetical protein EGY25_04265 [Brevundimonas intermedia]|uniref:Uncharacterized protein n=1 Tax=Brevundimonas intermedia TaxID=74315 RepID=A0A4Y9RZS9_9CAUL|nr:hypothetical protein [Brevundimonas intermedia]TFW14413.1 hypothetical protein EGY25_04265 [Brevundimonas intermedia]
MTDARNPAFVQIEARNGGSVEHVTLDNVRIDSFATLIHAVADGGDVRHITVTNIDASQLKAELTMLKAELRQLQVALQVRGAGDGKIRAIEMAIRSADQPNLTALNYLQGLGKGVLAVAKDIGVDLAAKVIAHSMRIPG